MKLINSLITSVINLINDGIDYPMEAVPIYSSSLMDMPLTKPTVAVGIDSMELNMSKLSSYGGLKNSVQSFSIPADITLRANIYVPQSMNGNVLYDALSLIIEALFYCDGLTLKRINCGDMFCNDTIRCIVLPLTINLDHRISGNSV